MSADRILNNILGKTKSEESKEPTFQDCKDGIKGLVKPFKDLYDKGKEVEEDLMEKIKGKKDGS